MLSLGSAHAANVIAGGLAFVPRLESEVHKLNLYSGNSPQSYFPGLTSSLVSWLLSGERYRYIIPSPRRFKRQSTAVNEHSCDTEKKL